MQIKVIYNAALMGFFALFFVCINIAGASNIGENIDTDGSLSVASSSVLLGNVGIATTSVIYPLSVGNNFYIDTDGKVTSNGFDTSAFLASGLSTLNGGLEINTDKFTIASSTGDTVIAGTLDVAGAVDLASVGILTNVWGSLSVDGAATFDNTLTVIGVSALNGGLTINTDKFIVASATGNTTIAGTLNVASTIDVVGAVDLASSGVLTNIRGTLSVDEAATLDRTLTVAGTTALNGGLTINTDKFIVASSTGNTTIAGTFGVTGDTTMTGKLTTTGATALNGGLTIATNKFSVASSTGNTAIAGTLNVTATTTLSNDLFVGSASGFDNKSLLNDAYVQGNLEVDGEAYIYKLYADTFAIASDYEIGETIKIGVASTTVDKNDYLFIGPEGKISDNGGDVEISDKLTVEQAAKFKGDIEVRNTSDTQVLYVNNTNGNVNMAGNLNISATTGQSIVEGDLWVKGTLELGASSIHFSRDNKINAFEADSPATLGTIAFNSNDITIISGDESAGIHPLMLKSTNFNVDLLGNTSVLGALSIGSKESATNKDSGSLVVEGGVGIEENLFVGANINAIGDIAAKSFSGDGSGLTNIKKSLEIKVTNGSHSGLFKDIETNQCVDGNNENLNGYQCMYNWIQTQGCEGYHVCDESELLAASQMGINLNSGSLWYNAGQSFNELVGVANDCNFWRDNDEVVFGNTWLLSNDKSYNQALSCNSSRQVACCK